MTVAMPRSAGEISFAKRSRSPAGIVRRFAVEQELLQPPRGGAREPDEPQLRVPRIAAGGRLRAHEAVPFRVRGRAAGSRRAWTVSSPTRSTAWTSAPPPSTARDVERHLALVQRHLAEGRVRVDERHAEAERLVEQRPELSAAVAEVECLLVVVVVVAHAASARLLGGAQLPKGGDLVGAVLAALALPASRGRSRSGSR